MRLDGWIDEPSDRSRGTGAYRLRTDPTHCGGECIVQRGSLAVSDRDRVDTTMVGTVLGQLLAGSVGPGASAQAMGADWFAILGGGTLVAAAVYGLSAWNELSESEDPTDNLVQDLADLVDPEITVMNPGSTDGGVVWMTSAQSGVGTLENLAAWSNGKAAAIPSWGNERADGLLGERDLRHRVHRQHSG